MTHHKTFRDVLQHFWSTTTIKGIPRAIKSASLVTRAFWGITTIACLAVLLFQASTILIKYYQYVVVINAYNANQSPHFPDVTVCAQTPYDAIAQFRTNYSVYSSYISNLRSQLVISKSSQYSNDDGFWEELQSMPSYITTQPLYSGTPPLPESSNFITDCSWFQWNWGLFINEEPGNVCRNRMTVNWNPNYYQCYDYHPPVDSLMGFSSIIYVDNFITNVFDATKMNLETSITPGIRIYIHPRNTIPLVLFEGVDVSPGNEFSVRLAETQVTHLGDPFGPCSRQSLLDPLDPDSFVYSQNGCLTICRQQQYIDKCGCLVPYEAFTPRQMQSVNGTFCTSKIMTSNATDKFTSLQSPMCQFFFWASNNACNCPPPCAETLYDITSSIVGWPSPANTIAFYNKYIKPFPEVYGTKFDAYDDLQGRLSNMSTSKAIAAIKAINLIPNNFIQLNIAFSTQNYQVNADMAAVGWETLFSNLGGALNLWMGITILFAAEVIEFLVAIVTLWLSNFQAPREESAEENTHHHHHHSSGVENLGMDVIPEQVQMYGMVTVSDDPAGASPPSSEQQELKINIFQKPIY